MIIQYHEKLIEKLNLNEIKYIKANKNHSIFIFTDNTIINSCYTLGRFEKSLMVEKAFKRIHNSFIVNVNFVSSVDLQASYLKLKDGEALPIGDKYKSALFF